MKFIFFPQDPYFKNPADEEPFLDLTKYWMDDKVFAEQRLAGVNPMTLMRVTTDKGRYMKIRKMITLPARIRAFSHDVSLQPQGEFFDL